MRLRPVCLCLLSIAALAACSREDVPPPGAQTPAAASPASAGAAPASAADGGVGMISSRGESVAGGGAPAGAAGSALDFQFPAGWTAQPPATSMRIGQATIPGPGGPGEIAVFFFGPGQGGSAEANIERWVGMVEMAPGATPTRAAFTANGFQITVVDASGTLKPSGMGTGPTTPQPDSRLLGAVVEGPGGPWFFKMTGPEKTIAPAKADFVAMLQGVKAKG